MRVFEEWVILKTGGRCYRGSNPTMTELEKRHPDWNDEDLIQAFSLSKGETFIHPDGTHLKRLT